MCGFCGVVAPRPLTTVELRGLERGTSLLRHRGPDDEGFVLIDVAGKACACRGDDSIAQFSTWPHIGAAEAKGQSVGLGARRLAILDLSSAGHMPMSDEDGNWIVFNGEIYNYRELQEELATLGHRFHSHSDTEVLLRAYARWEDACLQRLNGMWAFALWDSRRRRLFCSRDRFGEKQLYYHQTDDGVFWFASEIAPLRLVTQGREPVNQPLVWDFLMYGLADHTPETFFSTIDQLLPGTQLIFRPGESAQVTRYYDLKSRPVAVPRNFAAAATQLRQRLHDSVRLRLRSDVPVASFFSGGLDSTSIVALADQVLLSLNGNSPYKVLRTYTNTYPEGHRYDESPRVRAMLPRLRAAEAQFIPASLENFQRDLLALVASQEQPFHNVSIFAAYNLLRLIRQRDRIKVVLSGEAGDELLAGYQRVYLPLYLSRLLASRDWSTWRREVLAWNWQTGLKASVKGFFRKLPRPLRAGLQRFRNPVAGLMRPPFRRAHAERDRQITERWRGLDLNGRLVADLTQFNLPQLLRHLDRNAMRWSIETRLPFLDHHLVEFVCALPEEWKLHRGYSKYILRQGMVDDLPPAIAWNRAKLGFGMEEQFWLKECLELMNTSGPLNDFINVKRLAGCIRKDGPSAEQAYWLPLSLGLWLQTAYPQAH
jgi:asparagine synthase (glutamine-hydrolysing)